MSRIVLRVDLLKERFSVPRMRDSEVEQWVLRELSLSEIRSREVSVFARDGVVRLRGTAQSNSDKLAIEEAALRANGVTGVINEMIVKPSTALIGKVPFIQCPARRVLIQPKAIQQTAAKTAVA